MVSTLESLTAKLEHIPFADQPQVWLSRTQGNYFINHGIFPGLARDGGYTQILAIQSLSGNRQDYSSLMSGLTGEDKLIKGNYNGLNFIVDLNFSAEEDLGKAQEESKKVHFRAMIDKKYNSGETMRVDSHFSLTGEGYHSKQKTTLLYNLHSTLVFFASKMRANILFSYNKNNDVLNVRRENIFPGSSEQAVKNMLRETVYAPREGSNDTLIVIGYKPRRLVRV